MKQTKDCKNCGRANNMAVASCYYCGLDVSIKQQKKQDTKTNDIPDLLKNIFGGFDENKRY